MAEANAAASGGGSGESKESSSKINLIVIILSVINTVIVGAIAFMVYKGKQMEAANPGIDAVVRGEIKTQAQEDKVQKQQSKVLLGFKEFVVNLSGSRGRRVVKTSIELELPNEDSKKEIERREAQIRDQIILILSSRTFEDISGKEGKEQLRNDIKNAINPSLPEDLKILNVYFTDFIYN
jgi:flagellar FliL protein